MVNFNLHENFSYNLVLFQFYFNVPLSRYGYILDEFGLRSYDIADLLCVLRSDLHICPKNTEWQEVLLSTNGGTLRKLVEG